MFCDRDDILAKQESRGCCGLKNGNELAISIFFPKYVIRNPVSG